MENLEKVLVVFLTEKGNDLTDVLLNIQETYNENTFSYHNQKYIVVNEDKRKDMTYEYLDNLIDDMGIEAFSVSFQKTILSDYINKAIFDKCQEESQQAYIDDIRHEENRLQEEIEESNCEGEDDFLEYLCEEDSIKWFEWSFGIEEIIEFAKRNNAINWDGVKDECISLDGYAHFLSSYDGKENEINFDGETFYIYRTN